MTLIRCDAIVCPEGPLDGYVRLCSGRIAEVAPGEPAREPGERVVDLRGHRLLPGFVDVHVHGTGGWDTYDSLRGERDAAEGLARVLAACGTTAFLPTLATHRLEAMEEACRHWAAATYARRAEGGARVLGVHLEGPFLNPTRAGAQNPDWMLPPAPAHLDRLLRAAGGALRRVTLAPELPGADEAVRRLAAAGILVAAGHTDATYDQMVAARAAGVRLVNHAFNAMRGLHHREPGAAGAAVDPALGLDCEVIADGVHVHAALLRLLWRLKGPDGLAAISDAVAAALLPPGTYDLGAFVAVVGEDGVSRLASGALAGSTATMADCARVLTEAGFDLAAVAACTAAVPARLAGVGDRKGRIAPGYDADLVALDAAWRPVAVWVEGEAAFPPGEPPARETLLHPRTRSAAAAARAADPHDGGGR